ncbi:hypothetical protein LAZ67_4001441 [Cordylochernes scorpioides]|uniref:Reverse transcriptase domain-containing protein n=1 Tax=Cordylochernes scorpioides TaxID=51811 RepID=A0ABY6KBW2_9ARAC|nr:hypothetical protein LAZ67_4001441 [Cordylochernes scorpioides]
MRRLREAVRLKRTERWQNNDWILHVDNARPHTAHVVLQFLAKHSTIQIPYPPYSPDLAPNDFFLYSKLKMKLKGRKFDNVDMIQAESKATLRNLSKSDFISCFDNWKKRWNRNMNAGQAASIFTIIKTNFGPEVFKMARQLEKTMIKFARTKHSSYFNHRFKDLNIIPPSLNVKALVRTSFGRQIARRASLQFVKARIQESHRMVHIQRQCLASQQSAISELLDENYMKILEESIQRGIKKIEERLMITMRNKLDRWAPRIKKVDPRRVCNISGKDLTEDQLRLLDKGSNYRPMPLKTDYIRLISNIENGIRNLNENDKIIIRNKISNVISRKTKKQNNFELEKAKLSEWEAIKKLKNDEEIVITKADKGGKTVVMKIEDYNDKITNFLNDNNTYEEIREDPTEKIKLKISKFIKNMKSKDIDKRKMKLEDVAAPLFKGLPKIHKEGVPLRPIVSGFKAPTRDLADWLKNQVPSTRKISGLNDHEIMVSFDVKSLFTNINRTLALKELREYFEVKRQDCVNKGLEIDEMIEGFRLCLDNIYFRYGDKFYRQKDGTAMGCPTSMIIADIVMASVDKKAILIEGIKIWGRYIDDVFAVIRKENLDEIMVMLNNLEKGIEFTVETEREGFLSFLDVGLTRKEDGSILTSVFRKPTDCGIHLNFNSNNPMIHKRQVIKSLVERAKQAIEAKQRRIEQQRQRRLNSPVRERHNEQQRQYRMNMSENQRALQRENSRLRMQRIRQGDNLPLPTGTCFEEDQIPLHFCGQLDQVCPKCRANPCHSREVHNHLLTGMSCYMGGLQYREILPLGSVRSSSGSCSRTPTRTALACVENAEIDVSSVLLSLQIQPCGLDGTCASVSPRHVQMVEGMSSMSSWYKIQTHRGICILS